MSSAGHGCDWLKALHLSWEKSDLKILVWTDHGTTDSNRDAASTPEAVFPGHSLVLRCQSTVFDAMLSGGTFLEGKTGTVTLRGFTARAVEYFLRYLYTSCLPVMPEHHLLELLMLSHQYDVQGLFRECSGCLRTAIKVNNACHLYQTAVNLEADDLRDACGEVIRENLTIILENDLFHDMEKDLVYRFVCRDSSPQIRNAYRRLANFHFGTGETWSEDKLPSCVVLAAEDSPYRVSPRLDSFVSDLYMDNSHSDVELVVSNDMQTAHFPAHSLVLVSQSTVFLEKWKLREKSEKDERVRIHVEGYSPRTVEYMLGYMYTQYLASEVSDSQLMSLVALADAYQVDKLVDVCEKRLALVLTKVNICDMLSLAARLHLDDLRQHCLEDHIVRKVPFVVDNCLHFSLEPKEMALVMAQYVSSMRMRSDAKLKKVMEQWARWRLCLAAADSHDDIRLDSLVQSVLNLSLKTAPIMKLF